MVLRCWHLTLRETDDAMATSDSDSTALLSKVLETFARRVRDAQDLARRLSYLAASVEESIDDVTDFHAAVESLLGAAPVSDSTVRLLAVMTDTDRAVLRDMRRVRNDLVYDFFIRFPIERQDGSPDSAVLNAAAETLAEVNETFGRTRMLLDRLEVAISSAE